MPALERVEMVQTKTELKISQFILTSSFLEASALRPVYILLFLISVLMFFKFCSFKGKIHCPCWKELKWYRQKQSKKYLSLVLLDVFSLKIHHIKKQPERERERGGSFLTPPPSPNT